MQDFAFNDLFDFLGGNASVGSALLRKYPNFNRYGRWVQEALVLNERIQAI